MIPLYLKDIPKNKDYSDIINQIDKKLAKIAKIEYNNLTLHLKLRKYCKDCEKFSDLVYYKYILNRKLYSDECLCDIDIELIYNRIKQLLNS